MNDYLARCLFFIMAVIVLIVWLIDLRLFVDKHLINFHLHVWKTLGLTFFRWFMMVIESFFDFKDFHQRDRKKHQRNRNSCNNQDIILQVLLWLLIPKRLSRSWSKRKRNVDHLCDDRRGQRRISLHLPRYEPFVDNQKVHITEKNDQKSQLRSKHKHNLFVVFVVQIIHESDKES